MFFRYLAVIDDLFQSSYHAGASFLRQHIVACTRVMPWKGRCAREERFAVRLSICLNASRCRSRRTRDETQAARCSSAQAASDWMASSRRCATYEQDGDLLKRINLILPVQSHFQKYFRSRLTQIKSISLAVLSSRGAYRDRHGRGVGCGGRGSVGARRDGRAGRIGL
jgi:hypothetical protein